MKTVLLWVLSLLPATCLAQSNARFAAFMRDVVDSTLSSTALMEKHFCPALRHYPGEKGEESRKALVGWLNVQRRRLRRENLQLSELTFIAYDKLPARELPPPPFHMLSPTDHTYVARYHGQIVCYFLLRNGELASTLLLGQGIEHYFVDFCP